MGGGAESYSRGVVLVRPDQHILETFSVAHALERVYEALTGHLGLL